MKFAARLAAVALLFAGAIGMQAVAQPAPPAYPPAASPYPPPAAAPYPPRRSVLSATRGSPLFAPGRGSDTRL